MSFRKLKIRSHKILLVHISTPKYYQGILLVHVAINRLRGYYWYMLQLLGYHELVINCWICYLQYGVISKQIRSQCLQMVTEGTSPGDPCIWNLLLQLAKDHIWNNIAASLDSCINLNPTGTVFHNWCSWCHCWYLV